MVLDGQTALSLARHVPQNLQRVAVNLPKDTGLRETRFEWRSEETSFITADLLPLSSELGTQIKQ